LRAQQAGRILPMTEQTPKHGTADTLRRPWSRPMETQTVPATQVISPAALLEHWQGHRRLTRRVIEAFPEDQLFGYSVGGMRSFGTLANELMGIAVPMARGLVTDEWTEYEDGEADSKAGLLARWDESTAELEALVPRIAPERWAEQFTAFGMYHGTGWSHVFYAIDNEIHHRGQGYVYLRSLGIEPPPFWERG
jgi:uncharacterized damage-inducible protein DinB